MNAFFQWMKAHRRALIVACVMFGVMATCMVETLFAYDAWATDVFDRFSSLTVWIWRVGGAVTWPVFMWLLLQPHLGKAPDGQKVLAIVCAIAAAYGGFGLWAAYKLFEVMITAIENGAAFIVPLVMAVGMVLPFTYVWGFVILYGWGRTRLMQHAGDYAWLADSAIATVVGLYVIGALIYLALMFVSLPVALVASPLFAIGAEEAAFHVIMDVFAVAISTGNFASQWWAFYKVDENLDQRAAVAQPAPYAQPAPVVQPQQYMEPQQYVEPAPYGQPPQYGQPEQHSKYAQNAQPEMPAPTVPQEVPVAPFPTPLPRLFCTCGQELTLDESRLPDCVAKESFCPRCGARIAH